MTASVRLSARCDLCGGPFTLEEWEERCSPDERSIHANCCDECGPTCEEP